MTLASRVAVLHKGVLQQFDRPRAVYERPANMFVAGFMGSPSMNFLPAEIVEAGGKLAVSIQAANGTPVLLPIAGLVGSAGRRVVLGIRPEHFGRFTGSGNPTIGMIEAPTEVVEPTGAETMVVLRAAGSEIIARFEPDDAPEVGEVVKLSVDMNKACLFDPETQVLLN